MFEGRISSLPYPTKSFVCRNTLVQRIRIGGVCVFSFHQNFEEKEELSQNMRIGIGYPFEPDLFPLLRGPTSPNIFSALVRRGLVLSHDDRIPILRV